MRLSRWSNHRACAHPVFRDTARRAEPRFEVADNHQRHDQAECNAVEDPGRGVQIVHLQQQITVERLLCADDRGSTYQREVVGIHSDDATPDQQRQEYLQGQGFEEFRGAVRQA